MKKWIAAFRENPSVYLDEYGSWLLLSFVVCAIPILFTPLFADLTVSFSSLLVYCFTLIGATLYLFDHLVTIDYGRSKLAKTKKEIARAGMYVAVAVFVAYNLHDGFNTILNSYIEVTIPLTGVLVFIIIMALAIPLINRNVEEIIQKRKVDETQESADGVRMGTKNIRKRLEKERF